MTTLLIILVIINIILTVFYANKLEGVMRLLKSNTTEQIISSQMRTENHIRNVQKDMGELNEKVQSIMWKI